MPWICSRCFVFNSSLNKQCLLCLVKTGIVIPKERSYPDKNFNVLISWEREEPKMAHLTNEEIENNPNMNVKEKKFAKFFASEVTLVSSMDDAALKAHIEELQDIAFEARARLFASDGEFRERGAKKRKGKGFSTSVTTDDFTSDAINNIQERQKKLTKTEKEIERLVALGITRQDAENMYRATTMKAIEKQGVKAVVDDLGGIKDIVNSVMNASPEEKKVFSNPFAAKIQAEPEITIQAVNIIEETKDKIVLEIIEPSKEEIKKTFINPFVKKEE